MRTTLSLLGVGVATVLLLVSAAMNWRYGFNLGKTELDGHIYGAASAAADGLKALLPFFILWAIGLRNFIHAIAGIMLWVVCSSYSLTSAVGFAALNREGTTSIRAVQAVNYSDLREELDRSREKLSWVPQHRSIEEVDADLAVIMAQPIRGRRKGGRRRVLGTVGQLTDDCTKSGFRAQRLCSEVLNLRKELAVARQADKLETRIAEIKTQIGSLSRKEQGFARSSADPQALMLAKITGFEPAQVQLGLIILVAILVELGSGLGLFVAFSHLRHGGQRQTEIIEPNFSLNVSNPVRRLMLPKSDIQKYYSDRTEKHDGTSVTATALYEDYCIWCELNSKEPIALPIFGRQFSELGIQKAKIGGRIRYIGIRLLASKRIATTKDSDGLAAA